MMRSRSATARADRYFSRPMLTSTVAEDETSWKPAGAVKQYGEPAGEMTFREHFSLVRPGRVDAPADGVGVGLAAPERPGFAASAATVPVPSTVVAQAASRPDRPSRATARRRRMGPTVAGRRLRGGP